MHFPYNFSFHNDGKVPDDVADVFANVLIVEMGRPYVNGRKIDEDTWIQIKKIFKSRCMACFPVHYPVLYITLHRHKLTARASNYFESIMNQIRKRGCPCKCHL